MAMAPDWRAPPARDAGRNGGGDGQRRRIGETLVHLGLITKDQLEVALHHKSQQGGMLGSVLVDLGFISETTLSTVLAEATGFRTFDPASMMIDPDALIRVPKEMAQRHRVLPVSRRDNVVSIAMADPYDVLALDHLRRLFPREVTIVPLVAAASDLAEAIDRAYGYSMSIDGILQEMAKVGADPLRLPIGPEGYAHPVVRLVNAIVLDAVKLGASDLHFEPDEYSVRLRYRIDGVLTQVRTLHKDHWPAVLNRLKILAGMDIADRLSPQDGRFSLHIDGRDVDFRASCLPIVHGENIVLRVLDKSRSLSTIEQLGFSDHNRAVIERILRRPEGIVVVTGPTGSGKTTTLYAILGKISSVEVNIMTLEDPVEYAMPLVRQAQVREASGIGFGDGVRAILRQDPDIVFIGEVRDAETAQMALRAAMTGHQVFTTLHTNDAFGAIPRLLDLGLKPGMLAGNIIGVLAQRLVRRLCVACKRPAPATEAECRLLGVDPAKPPTLHHPVGCPKCRDTGYAGRMALAEVLPIDDSLDAAIIEGGSRPVLRAVAKAAGFRPLVEDGVARILAGDTSIDAVSRVVDLTNRA